MVKPFKPKVGQPAYLPTVHDRARVMDLITVGYTHEQIAVYFDTDRSTLYKHFRNELDKTLEMRMGKVGRKLYQVAMSGDVKALELMLKCKAQWHSYKPPEKDDKLDQVTSLLQTLVDQNKTKIE